MLSYELLDSIADAFNPALLIAYLALTMVCFLKEKRPAKSLFFEGLFGLFLTYALLLIDKSLGIWVYFGLDYSTHTVFAIALIYPVVGNKIPFNKVLMITFVGYAALMLYQGYHSLLDIASSAIIFLAIDYLAIKMGYRIAKNNKLFSRLLND